MMIQLSKLSDFKVNKNNINYIVYKMNQKTLIPSYGVFMKDNKRFFIPIFQATENLIKLSGDLK